MSDPRDLTTLGNAKAWLNIPATQTSEDALLTRLVTAESLLFLQAINRANLNQASYTEKRNGSGGSVLMVRNYPIISVQSLTIEEYRARRQIHLYQRVALSEPSAT